MTDTVEEFLDDVWGSLSALGDNLVLAASSTELQLGHAYEALLFMKLAVRAQAEGHAVDFLDENYTSTAEIVFNNGRGSRWTALRGTRSQVPCNHGECRVYELHHSAWAPGNSTAQHDCDIAVTKVNGRSGASLNASAILGLLEAKCRGSKYPESLDTGRSVAGKDLDFTATFSALVSRQGITTAAQPYMDEHLHTAAVVPPTADHDDPALDPVWVWLDACSSRCKQ